MEFQSTLPHGERRAALKSASRQLGISIHAPARGATPYGIDYQSMWVFQSTLPHGERRGGAHQNPQCTAFQSTLPHGERQAPASPPAYTLMISIHAPARGATTAFRKSRYPAADFNPRSRTGSDLPWRFHRRSALPFQSTLPHGERRVVQGVGKEEDLFQSTLPHGERPQK